ncbi:phage protein [Desulfovibrio psychrotolerans]|uniref:Tail protein n=1 Tax=Desulfovibrio psychrotolerans TaxID=415242 RepID=A0A7J0BVJ2_9BACT|nr:phage protein [Desulfovibrio psychrotolerans]GFM37736.1 tail protein [Desulfovibrio psychrotolerans]
MSRISGKCFDFQLGDLVIHAEKFTCDIEDGSEVAKTKGVPVGRLSGPVGASGEIEVDSTNLKLVIEAARSAGSFREMPTFDIVAYAKAGDEEKRVEIFGCALKVSKLLDVDSNSATKDLTTLPYEVTSPDFVRINGVPYLSADETEGL